MTSPLPLMGNRRMRPDIVYCPVITILGTVTSSIFCCLSKSYLENQSWDDGISQTSCLIKIWFYGMISYSRLVGTRSTNKKNIIHVFGAEESEFEKIVPIMLGQYTWSVRKVSDLLPRKRNWLTWSVGHLITFKVVPLGLHTLLPAVPPLLEACRKSLFRNGV